MTTTAHEDQFTAEPEPVRQPYDTGSILRRNVVDLELALKQQAERAEAAEAELAKLREQKPALYMAFSECGQFIRYWTRDTANLDATMAVNDFTVLEFFARPVPATAVPTDEHQQEMTSFRLRVRSQDDATFAALRDEVNGLTGSLHRAESVLQNLMSFLSVNGCRTEIDPENAELRIRDGINMLVRPAVERAELAEKALKEAQEQPPVAWCNKDHLYGHLCFKAYWSATCTDNGVPLYARPVPAAPAVAVPAEWREVRLI